MVRTMSCKLLSLEMSRPLNEVTITIWVLVKGVKNQDLLSFDPIIGDNRITIHLPWNEDIVW